MFLLYARRPCIMHVSIVRRKWLYHLPISIFGFDSKLLHQAKQKKPQAMPQWPVTRLKLIMTSLGGRAKHTVIREPDSVQYQMVY